MRLKMGNCKNRKIINQEEKFGTQLIPALKVSYRTQLNRVGFIFQAQLSELSRLGLGHPRYPGPTLCLGA